MEKTITIKGRYTVHVHIKLRTNKDNRPAFSCSADCNRLHVHGQCLDDINPYMQDSTMWKIIYRLWKAYHLNDFNAGTRKQDNFLRLEGLENAQYIDKVKALRDNGLLTDNGHAYGHGWLYREIPADDLAIIKAIIEA